MMRRASSSLLKVMHATTGPKVSVLKMSSLGFAPLRTVGLKKLAPRSSLRSPPTKTSLPPLTASSTFFLTTPAAVEVISGPIVVPGTSPSPILSFFTSPTSFSRNASSTLSWTRNLSLQTHVWPALRNFDPMAAFTATSRSASSNTTKGALPPSSREARLMIPPSLHCLCRIFPTLVEPVKLIFLTSSLVHISLPNSGVWSAPNGRTSKAASGMPAFLPISMRATAERGVSSEGFTTEGQPAARAGPTFLVIIARGKFQGVMKPQTPTASFTDMSVPLLSLALGGCANGEGMRVPPLRPFGLMHSPAK
mmetsp:Transcript_12235/g.24273  ORF Transcript_12235/g.24273 Transcript_12235/m.24273 type:complete len:308 (-) Transcript_12235:456-1379(-)